MAITNFYEALSSKKKDDKKHIFSAENSIQEIKQVLGNLETLWNSRSNRRPEEARKVLVLLDEAKIRFADEASKQKYDKELADNDKEPEVIDPDADRKAKFEDWLEKATDYYQNRQYDLAVTAIKKVFEFRVDENEVDSYILAAWVFNDAHQYATALDYINQAIIINPEYAVSYRAKYVAMYNTLFTGEEMMDKTTALSKGNELYSLLNQYIERAELTGNPAVISEAKEFVAGEYFFNLSGFIDRDSDQFYPLKLSSSQEAAKGVTYAKQVPNSTNGSYIISASQKAEEYEKSKEILKDKKLLDWGWLFNKVIIFGVVASCVFLRGLGVFLSIVIVGGGIYYVSKSNNEYKTAQQNEEAAWRDLYETYKRWAAEN